jgi:hypothetical protein
VNCNILKTGSDGNCIIINEFIALDMGVPFKLVEPHMKKLALVFLTHVHS